MLSPANALTHLVHSSFFLLKIILFGCAGSWLWHLEPFSCSVWDLVP